MIDKMITWVEQLKKEIAFFKIYSCLEEEHFIFFKEWDEFENSEEFQAANIKGFGTDDYEDDFLDEMETEYYCIMARWGLEDEFISV